MNYLNLAISFIAVIVVHELGHYFACKYYKHNPKVRFRWYGIEIGYNVTPRSLRENYIIALIGITTGYFVWILAFPSNTIWMYFAMCLLDFFQMMQMFLVPRKLRGAPISEAMLYNYRLQKKRERNIWQ